MERRGEDSPAAIQGRLDSAEKEIMAAREYRYVIMNDELEKAYCELKRILETEWRRDH